MQVSQAIWLVTTEIIDYEYCFPCRQIHMEAFQLGNGVVQVEILLVLGWEAG